MKSLFRLLVLYAATVGVFSEYAHASVQLTIEQDEIKTFGKLLQPGDQIPPLRAMPAQSFVFRYLLSGRSKEAERICTALYQGSDIDSVKDGALQCLARSHLISGHFDKAEALILTSVADSEPLTGREASRHAANLFALATLYQERGYFLLADKVLQKAANRLENDAITLIPESTRDHLQATRLNQADKREMDRLIEENQQLMAVNDDQDIHSQQQRNLDALNSVTARFIRRTGDQAILMLHLTIIRARWQVALILGEDDTAFSLLKQIITLSAKYDGRLLHAPEALMAYHYLMDKNDTVEAAKYLALAKKRATSDIGYPSATQDPLPTTFNIPAAVSLFGDPNHSGIAAYAMLNLGRVYLAEGNIAESQRFLSAALKGMQFTYGEDSNEVAAIHYEQALIMRQAGKLTAALTLLRKALATVIANDEDVALLPSGRAMELIENRNNIALEIIDLLYTSPQILTEPQRMQVLFETFQCLHRQSTQSSISAASLRQEQINPQHRQLLDDYQTAVRQLANTRSGYARFKADAFNGNAGQMTAVNLPQQLRDQQNDVTRLRNNLVQLGILSTSGTKQPARLMDIQKRLLPGELTLQFAFNNTHGYVLATTHQQQHLALIKTGRNAFRKDVKTLLQELSPSDSNRLTFSLPVASKLYQQSLADVLDHFPQVTRLLIIADGVWDGLPFSVLVTNGFQQERALNDYNQVDWLIRRYEIAYLPSPAALVELRARAPSKAPDDILGIGSPVGVMPQSVARGSFVASLLPQPAVEAPSRTVAVGELEKMATFFAPEKRKMLIGAEATRNNFYNAMPENYKILVFATHGYLASDLLEIGEPSLLLSSQPQESKPALLTVNEIAAKRIDANLVLLNACNTAGSDGMPGAESLTGMANAFFFSGARAVVASLWSVNDHSATAMGVGLIGQSASHRQATTTSLLQQTMLMELQNGRGKTKHPYYWAPYIIIGDPAIVPLQASTE